MDDRKQELKRIERALFQEEDTAPLEALSVDDILSDPELNALVGNDSDTKDDIVFEDLEMNVETEDVQYQNFANAYGQEVQTAAWQNKLHTILLSVACGLSAGVIGLLIYWLTMLK